MEWLKCHWKLVACVSLPVVGASAAYCYLYLREHEDDDEVLNSQKQPATHRSSLPSIEMAVPADRVGAVIGRKGSVMRQIESDCQVILRFKNEKKSDDEWQEETEAKDRQLSIQGHWENIQLAELEVEKIINATIPSLRDHVFVPKGCIGMIIGKSGESIKEIRRSCRVRIQVEETGGDPEQISIWGAPSGIEQAKSMIKEVAERFKSRQSETQIKEETKELWV